jgi:hypothetical protein
MDMADNVSAALDGSLFSSPPRMPPNRGKERRNPSITPRKFKRFFTPRPRVSSKPSAARRALRDLTAPALNRCLTPMSSPLKPISEEIAPDELVSEAATRGYKRRKFQHTPESSPLRSTLRLESPPALLCAPDTKPALLSPIESRPPSQSNRELGDSDVESEDDLPTQLLPIRRPVPLANRGMSAQLVQRMTGGVPRGGHASLSCPVADWRTETADFCSGPEDVHLCSSNEGAARCIPFCVASCHSKSIRQDIFPREPC